MIIRSHVGRQGQGSLVLVKQHLEDNVAIVLALAVEHKLDVGCHGEYLEVNPAVEVQSLHIGNLAAIAVKV